jgi:hypothetical protein
MMTCFARLRFSILLLAAAIAAAPAQAPVESGAATHQRPEQGDPMPDFPLKLATDDSTSSLNAALEAKDVEGPLVVAFLHRDKELCVRFLDELASQVETLGDGRGRCSILLVFCGEERDGAVIDAAKKLSAPFRLCWDADRSAYQRMGMIAFPTVYIVDRTSRVIDVLRRGYVITLAREVAGRLKVGLGLITKEELARQDHGSLGPSSAMRQHATRMLQAWQLLRSGKAKDALQEFEAMLTEDGHDIAAQAGQAVAAWRIGQPDARDLLESVHRELPDDTAVALALGEALLAVERLDAAEPLLRSALEREGAPAWFALGRLYELQSNWREASGAYREAARRSMR